MRNAIDAADEIRRDYEERYRAPRTERIEAGRVRDFLAALGEDGWSAETPVPRLFLLTLGRTRRPQPSRGSAVNAGESLELFHPVRVDDVITIRRRVTSVQQKQGSRGRMYLVEAQGTFVDQRGRTVAHQVQKTLRWGW